MIGRRGFLKAIGVGVLGLSMALRNPEQQFSFKPPRNEETGISIRFIKNWEVVESCEIRRLDVLYGYAELTPQFVARMTDKPQWLEPFVRLVSRFKLN